MEQLKYFGYGKTEIDYLKSKDPVLGAVIDRIGYIERPVIPDLYEALVNSIVGQQISTKALNTIWEQIQARFAPLTPEHLAVIPAKELQSCGISMRKANYIKKITEEIIIGNLDLEELQGLPDAQVCTRLCKLPGIGIWTAEMLLIFSMQRPDILSFGDLAIQRGLRMVYHHRKITPSLYQKYKRRYSPYGTVASLYLWAVAQGAVEGMHDYAPKSPSGKKN